LRTNRPAWPLALIARGLLQLKGSLPCPGSSSDQMSAFWKAWSRPQDWLWTDRQ
jgi:hypothetical protein